MRPPVRRRLVVSLVALLTACAGGTVFSLEVGDCFMDPEEGAAEVTDVEVVDCEEPHDSEVFHAFELGGVEYPGVEAIQERVVEECSGEAFEDFIGQPYEASEVEVYTVTPTERSWNDVDDRAVVCAAYVESEELEGSLEGSGR